MTLEEFKQKIEGLQDIHRAAVKSLELEYALSVCGINIGDKVSDRFKTITVESTHVSWIDMCEVCYYGPMIARNDGVEPDDGEYSHILATDVINE